MKILGAISAQRVFVDKTHEVHRKTKISTSCLFKKQNKKTIKTKITKFLRLKTNSFCMCSLVSQASVDYSTNTPHKYDPRFRGPQYTHWQCASPASLRRTSLSLSFSLCLNSFSFSLQPFFPSVSAGLFFCCCCSACDRFFF